MCIVRGCELTHGWGLSIGGAGFTRVSRINAKRGEAWDLNRESLQSRNPVPLRPRGGMMTGLNSLPSSDESGRRGWAALTRTIQVLEGDQHSLNTCNLISRTVSGRETERRDVGIIDDMSGIEVAVQCSDNFLAIGRACTWDFDRFSIGAFDSTITVSGASWVTAL